MSARKQPVSPKAHDSARQTSALARTLKAKLQVLKRPAVWGSLVLLLLPLIFLASYWNALNQAPETADASSNPVPLDPALAPETAAPEAALPALLQPDLFNILNQPPAQPSPQAKSQVKPEAKSPAKPEAASKPQPGAVPALPSLDSTSSTSKANSESGAAADPTQPATLSPLQSALNRRTEADSTESTSPSERAAADSTSAQATSIYEFGSSTNQAAGQTAGQAAGQTNQTRTGQSPTGLPYPAYVPQTSPAAGTTGYTLPSALRTPVNPAPLPVGPSQLPAVPIPNQSLGAGYSAPVPTPTVIAPQPQTPFSVPRVPPGRYIGNGEINTFSNP